MVKKRSKKFFRFLEKWISRINSSLDRWGKKDRGKYNVRLINSSKPLDIDKYYCR